MSIQLNGIDINERDHHRILIWKDGYITKVVDPLLRTEAGCKQEAEANGALAWDEAARQCWLVYGKKVIIGPTEHDIQEGFEITNFNFHTNGNQPAVPTQNDLPQSGNMGNMGTKNSPMGI